jgi:hypothetical protein
MKTGVRGGISDTEYHSCRDSLSASGAKLLLPPSCPAKFKYRMDSPPVSKPEFDFGRLSHKMVLGEGAQITEIGAPDYRTQTARALRDEAIANGEIPALTSEIAKARDMAIAVRKHPIAGPLFTDGYAETSLYAVDPDTGVNLRARPDYMKTGDSRTKIIDFKTAADANPETFGRTALRWGYEIQMAWYITVAQLLKLDADPAFLFVCIEKTPPYLVSVMELDTEAFNLGKRRMREAIDIYQRCMETGEWPGYPLGISPISLPSWATDEEMEIA